MKLKFLIISILLSTRLIGQDIIELSNPSFEDIPSCCNPPQNWETCGPDGSNTPDIQPGYFDVSLNPKEGETYLGLITRDIHTWEAVSQKIDGQIQTGKKYSFSLFLAQSLNYNSHSKMNGKEANYNQPIKLRIWGGNNYCEKGEMLGESAIIDHEDWQEYEFVFQPKENYTFITFEAFYNTPTPLPYNGHILLDNCSEIKQL